MISTTERAIVDTNVLVYRFDARYPAKQQIANALLAKGLESDTVRLPHQAIVEFVAAVTRPIGNGRSLLSKEDAWREAEDLLHQFVVLYPNQALVTAALRGTAVYQMSWFDAHLWAYAEHYGLPVLFSEHFEDGRRYGNVRVVNPFA